MSRVTYCHRCDDEISEDDAEDALIVNGMKKVEVDLCWTCAAIAGIVDHDERYGRSPSTGNWYRVTEWTWVNKDEGRLRADEKEEVDEQDVPEKWKTALDTELPTNDRLAVQDGETA